MLNRIYYININQYKAWIFILSFPYSGIWEKALETSTPTPQALVTGLVEGNEYQFRVIALNKAGQSKPSEPSKTFIAKPRYRKLI